ncbi:MAG: glycosyltransferase [Spirochaetaceae bacterium]|nr:MAG: glycosyltransferase [Spirochaetaceae bacterium]
MVNTENAQLISVIIPTHNRLAFLKDAVASVLNQTCCGYEIIVVDDGSTDGTAEWLSENGINHISIPHSGFPGCVRNAGVLALKGKWIAFLDSDDLWKPEKLSAQKEFLEAHPELELVHTREIWNRSGKIISQSGQKHSRSGRIFTDALSKCIIGPSTVIMSRRLFEEFGGFDETLEIAEDYEFWLAITARYPVGFLDIPLVENRGGHKDQLSEKYGYIELFRIKALEKTLERGIYTGQEQKLIHETLAGKCMIHALGAFKRGKSEEYEEYSKAAARHAAWS